MVRVYTAVLLPQRVKLTVDKSIQVYVMCIDPWLVYFSLGVAFRIGEILKLRKCHLQLEYISNLIFLQLP